MWKRMWMDVFGFFVIPISIIVPGVWWCFLFSWSHNNIKISSMLALPLFFFLWMCVCAVNHHLTEFKPTLVVNLCLPSQCSTGAHNKWNSLHRFTILHSQSRYVDFYHISSIGAPCIGTSKYQMFALSSCIVLTRTRSHQICFRFRFSDCDGSFSISRTMSENCHRWATICPFSPTHTQLSVSTICLSTSLRLIYLSHSVVFFWFKWRWVCMCACLCFHWIDELCGGCREANTWEKKSTLFIFWVVDQMPIHTTKANEVYAINW